MYIFPSYLWINNQSSLIFHMNSKVSNYLSTSKNCNPEEGDKQGEDKKPTLNEVTQHIKHYYKCTEIAKKLIWPNSEFL